MLIDMSLPEFDIYQCTVAPNIISWATETLDVLILFLKKTVLSDVQSKINLIRRNIVSTRQSVRA